MPAGCSRALGGSGNVAVHAGIDGVPADTDRDTGFQAALADYPDITVVAETFTGWDPTVGSQQAADILGTQEVDGIWTSGIDYTVVPQFETAGVEPVPLVGADNNAFIGQLIEGQPGAAVTNPPAIGGVGTAVAIEALTGGSPEQNTILTPEVFDGAAMPTPSTRSTSPISPTGGAPTWRSTAVHDVHRRRRHRLRTGGRLT